MKMEIKEICELLSTKFNGRYRINRKYKISKLGLAFA